MKIKMTKTIWAQVGTKAGWLKTAQTAPGAAPAAQPAPAQAAQPAAQPAATQAAPAQAAQPTQAANPQQAPNVGQQKIVGKVIQDIFKSLDTATYAEAWLSMVRFINGEIAKLTQKSQAGDTQGLEARYYGFTPQMCALAAKTLADGLKQRKIDPKSPVPSPKLPLGGMPTGGAKDLPGSENLTIGRTPEQIAQLKKWHPDIPYK